MQRHIRNLYRTWHDVTSEPTSANSNDKNIKQLNRYGRKDNNQ